MERALARALSRHIGYTTGAYDLDRIMSVLDRFSGAASAYRHELVASFREESSQAGGNGARKTPEDSYFEEIITFAESMGLVETVSAKESNLKRMSATERGRSLLGAKATGNLEFYAFYSTKTVLLADADALYAVLSYYRTDRRSSLQDHYLEFYEKLRFERHQWLLKAFSEPLLLERVAKNITWLKKVPNSRSDYSVDLFSKNTARHHSTPRKGWLHDLGMLDLGSEDLTEFGTAALNSLAPTGHYFWLGPPEGTLGEMRIQSPEYGATSFEDTFNFTDSDNKPATSDISQLIIDTASIMRVGYESSKLIHASQASLRLPIEYIQYRSFIDRKNYGWREVLEALFHANKSNFERLSASKGQIGFYKYKNMGAII